jgi:hypothetical protein
MTGSYFSLVFIFTSETKIFACTAWPGAWLLAARA